MGHMSERDRVDILLERWGDRLAAEDRALTAVTKRVAIVHRRLAAETADALDAIGVGAGEFDVLATLLREAPRGAMRPRALKESMMWSSGGISNVLRRLEQVGMIARRGSREDGRAALVSLTPRGRALAERAIDAVTERHRQTLEPLSGEQLARLADALRLLTLAVDPAGPPSRTRR